MLLQAFIKTVKNKAYYKRFQVKYRRRRGMLSVYADWIPLLHLGQGLEELYICDFPPGSGGGTLGWLGPDFRLAMCCFYYFI